MLQKVHLRMTNLLDTDNDGNTLLHRLLQNRQTEKVYEVLTDVIKSGENGVLNIQNKQGDTPLHIAVRHYPLDKLPNLMITLGASIDIVNNQNERVCVAKTISEFLKKTNYAIDMTPPEDMWTISAITILDDDDDIMNRPSSPVPPSALFKDVPVMSDLVSYPDNISVEDLLPPALISNHDLETQTDEKNARKSLTELIRNKKSA